MEISHLKARQSGLQEEVQKLQRSAQSASDGLAVLPVTTASSTTTSSSSSSFLSRHTASHQGFHGEEMDLSDVIWSQQEINRLSTEVMRLEAEVAHWRRMSQVNLPELVHICSIWWFKERDEPYLKLSKMSKVYIVLFLLQASTGAGNGDQSEILKLQRTIKVNVCYLLLPVQILLHFY